MTAPSLSTCPHCGSGVNPASRFCANCGASLSGDAGASVSAAVAPQGRLSDSGALELKAQLVAATAGDYEILDELGRGGMAVVYRAIEVHLKRPVAIKILPPELTYAKGSTERFQREAQTAAALDHPNIIPIYRISSGGRLCWYAMKFLEGRSLADIISEKGLLTVNETIQILEQVGSALDYAHQRGVVHRDVKPGNVMLDVNGRVTVTDFGIAKELTSGALTGSGAILGTPYYMSPEQCRGGKDLTGAADQYSLGVMAYQMVSGQLPFDADSAIDVIHKHVSEPPPPLETLLPGLPKHVVAAINMALSKKASDRFPTVAAFVGALRHGPDMGTLKMRKSAVLRSLGRKKKPLSRGVLAAAAVAVLAVGTGLWALSRNAGAPPSAAGAHTQGAAIGPPSSPTQPETRAPAPTGGTTEPGKSPARRSPPRTRTNRPTRPVTRPLAASPATATQPQSVAASGAKGLVTISLNTLATITINGRTPVQKRIHTDSLPPGQYSVRIEKSGYTTVTLSFSVSAGRNTELPVTLRQAGGQ